MKYALTKRQGEALAFIRKFIKEQGIAPSTAELAKGLGLASKSRAYYLIEGLEKRGYVKKQPHLARSLTLVSDDQDEVRMLRQIRDAANAFVSIQENFRRVYEADPNSVDTQKQAPRLEGAFNNLRLAVRGEQ